MEQEKLSVEVLDESKFQYGKGIDRIIFDLDDELDSLSSGAEMSDYLVAASSGLLCGCLDILWLGEFSLEQGRSIAKDKVDWLVIKMAKACGCTKEDPSSCVKFLEGKFRIPSDGNASSFGGGKFHHLRDFAHHPTIFGLLFSMLTQFTGKAYGTDAEGRFICVDIVGTSRRFIGETIPQKIRNGTIIWFFHLVSDIAGSSRTAGALGGTGIPGPMLSLAKEISALPFFQNSEGGKNRVSVFLSKLFSGTLFADYDENGKMIKESAIPMDLRGESGVYIEWGKQALPVLANECMVRVFYFIRRLAVEMRKQKTAAFSGLKKISLNSVESCNSPTLTRMLTISSCVFTTIDITHAIATKKWIEVNYCGVCRFAVAIGGEMSWALKRRHIERIKEVYETIRRNAYNEHDSNIYSRICADLELGKFELTLEQTEILYNIEYYKTLNDIEYEEKQTTKELAFAKLKRDWLKEWKERMGCWFPDFIGKADAELHWLSYRELQDKIAKSNPQDTWYKLVMLEATLFVPYYPLGTERDKKGREIPSKKYKRLKGLHEAETDEYLENNFSRAYCQKGFIKRIRNGYKEATNRSSNLKEPIQNKTILTIPPGLFGAICGVPLAVPAISGAWMPILVGGVAGAVAGAVAVGEAGNESGKMTIVGGGAILCSDIEGLMSMARNSKDIVCQSAKFVVAVHEVFLNEEKDIAFSDIVLKRYISNQIALENALTKEKEKAKTASPDEKEKLKKEIENVQKSVDVMKNDINSMKRLVALMKKTLEKNCNQVHSEIQPKNGKQGG